MLLRLLLQLQEFRGKSSLQLLDDLLVFLLDSGELHLCFLEHIGLDLHPGLAHRDALPGLQHLAHSAFLIVGDCLLDVLLPLHNVVLVVPPGSEQTPQPGLPSPRHHKVINHLVSVLHLLVEQAISLEFLVIPIELFL